MTEPFTLRPHEAADPLWVRLKAHLEARLLEARAQNDNPQLDAAATAALRGRIAVLKGLIALDRQMPETE